RSALASPDVGVGEGPGESDALAERPEGKGPVPPRSWPPIGSIPGGAPKKSRISGPASGKLVGYLLRCGNDLSAHPVRGAATHAAPQPTAGTRGVRFARPFQRGGATDERGDPHPVGHRARRPVRRRPTVAPGLRRAAPAGGAATGAGEAGADAAADGAGSRSLP